MGGPVFMSLMKEQLMSLTANVGSEGMQTGKETQQATEQLETEFQIEISDDTVPNLDYVSEAERPPETQAVMIEAEARKSAAIALFNQMDLNHDGSVSLDEFLQSPLVEVLLASMREQPAEPQA